MTNAQKELLAHSQRDARIAVLLHTLLLILLIVLWTAHLRLRFFSPIEAVLVRLIFGSP